jgi:uncharacterized protein YpmB
MIVEILIIIGVILAIALGFGYIAFKSLKPKSAGWNCRVWTLSENGNDLIPYGTDVIVKQQVDINVFRYKLQKLQLDVPQVTPEDIKAFGETKYVDVLYHGGRATLMKTKASITRGNIDLTLTPIDFDVFTFAEFQKNNRLRRLEEKGNPMESILKWASAIMFIICIIMVSYIVVDGLVQVSKNQAEGTNNLAKAIAKQNELKELELEMEGKITSINNKNTVVVDSVPITS